MVDPRASTLSNLALELIRAFTLGLIAAIATVAPSHAQTGGTSIRIVHLTVNWIDSTRPEPWPDWYRLTSKDVRRTCG